MKKLQKTIFSMLMALGLLLSIAGCGAPQDSQPSDSASGAPTETPDTSPDVSPEESTDPAEGSQALGQYYTGDVAGMTAFFHFNEDGTYYCAFYDGGMTDAGTYTVVDGTLDYYTEYDGDAKTFVESSKQTAERYVELTSYGQSATDTQIPLVDDTLASVNNAMTHCMVLTRDDSFADPNGVESNFRYVVLQLFAENNSVKTLTLYHDMSYEDLTGDLMTDGSYTIDGDGSYTLTESLEGTVFTLNVDAEGAATLTGGEEEKTLRNAIVSERTFEGEFELTTVDGETINVIQGQTAQAVLECNAADGTYTLSAHLEMYSGSVVLDFVLDEGTYEEGTDATYMDMIPTFAFNSNNEGAEINVERQFDQQALTATYTVSLNLSAVTATIPFNGADFTPAITGSGTVTLTYTVEM